MRADVLLDGQRGVTGDLFHVVSGAVVAILAMQTHHGRDVLLNEVGLPRVPQVLAQPVIVGNVFRADRPSQHARVLLGQTLDAKGDNVVTVCGARVSGQADSIKVSPGGC